MTAFAPKLTSQLTEADFAAHSVWASYDDPEEMELLESLGFEAADVMGSLRGLATVEESVFPLPPLAATMPFRYLWLSANISLPNGAKLVGYRTSACLGIYHDGVCYQFNKALPDLSRTNADLLALALGAPTIFPVKAHFPATAKTEMFSL